MVSPYRRERGELARIVVLFPQEELDAIDSYGAPSRFPSRTATIRDLVQRGLKTVSEPAVGQEA